MKKAKIMLMGVAVVAVVGGALAFKAKTFNLPYCVATNGSTTCTTGFQAKVGGSTLHNYTTTTNTAACAGLKICSEQNGLVEPE